MRRRGSTWLANLGAGSAIAGAALWMGAQPAHAHGVGGRADLPLPVWMVAYAAAAVLVVSFVGLARLWPTPRLEGARDAVPIPGLDGRFLEAGAVILRILGLCLFLLVWAAAAFGENDPAANLAPRAVYVVFWVGLIVMSGLVGDVWRALSPYDTLAAVAQRLRRRRRAGDAPQGGHDYRLGHWPAAVGLAAFTWLELAHPNPASPRVLAVAIAVYTVAVLAGAAWWGRCWVRQGETFAAFFGLLSAMAPLCRDDEGRLCLRPPLVGLAHLEVLPGTAALVIVALGSTSFDGLSRTAFWADVIGNRTGWDASALATLGLAWMVGLVAVLYIGATRLAARVVNREPMALVDVFAHSLVPIALAYAVAHYFSLLVFEGQGAYALASDPFGWGWNLFGTASSPIDYRAVSTATIAYVQAGAIVAGHVAGVVLAHDRAVATFRPRLATRSQYPLLAAMVGYTVGGLVLLLGG